MNFGSVGEFLAMGGHAPFVWSAYGIALGVVVYNIVQPLLSRQKVLSVNRQRLARMNLSDVSEADQ